MKVVGIIGIVVHQKEYHTWQQELQYRKATMTKKNNVDVEFDSDVGYPYHLQPDIIKMALFIHNAESEQEKINRVEFGVNKFDYKFMAHVMAMLMLPWLMDKNMDSNEFKDWVSMREKKMN
jgi:hypothetical protein